MEKSIFMLLLQLATSFASTIVVRSIYNNLYRLLKTPTYQIEKAKLRFMNSFYEFSLKLYNNICRFNYTLLHDSTVQNI